jgi:hypothetical protein
MLRFFDYTYYRICRWYISKHDSSARIAGLLILSLLHLFNVLVVYVCFCLVFHIETKLSKPIEIAIALIILIFNGIRYNKFNYDVLSRKWKEESSSLQDKKAQWVFAYILLSILLTIILIFRNLF